MKYTYETYRKNFDAPDKHKGSMLVISVFVIVVFAFLSVTITRLLSTSQDAIVYEVLGLRALNAARSGLEQKVLDVFSGQTADSARCTADDAPVEFGSLPGLQNCSVTFVCTTTRINDIDYFRFDSRGQCISEDLIVSRTVSIDGKNIN